MRQPFIKYSADEISIFNAPAEVKNYIEWGKQFTENIVEWCPGVGEFSILYGSEDFYAIVQVSWEFGTGEFYLATDPIALHRLPASSNLWTSSPNNHELHLQLSPR
jgi:hypothetical protein